MCAVVGDEDALLQSSSEDHYSITLVEGCLFHLEDSMSALLPELLKDASSVLQLSEWVPQRLSPADLIIFCTAVAVAGFVTLLVPTTILIGPISL